MPRKHTKKETVPVGIRDPNTVKALDQRGLISAPSCNQMSKLEEDL
jgi:hypothetical protein